ncbi:MAG TPA: autotransporter domain-containing protein [Syntrophales bacterium]|nr:autotransporter domain-containing protein [Syntrophales bacterium]
MVKSPRMMAMAWPVLSILICLVVAATFLAPSLYAQGAYFSPTEKNDPYFFPLTSGGNDYPGQWHLWNQAPLGDVNKGQSAGLEKAWNLEGKNVSGYTGRGVVIGIVDDGVEGTHEDLKDNYRPYLSKIFSQDDSLAAQAQGPVQNSDNHGTAVAGVAAARGGNGIGGVGAAPNAGIAGLRVRLGESLPDDPAGTVQDSYDAYLWKSGLNNATLAIEAAPEIHIKNHSYGPEEPFEIGEGSDRIKDILKATSENTVVHVFSAGNARNRDKDTKKISCEDANKDFTITSPYVMAVAALGSDGTYAYYSSYGANVFVTAPSSSYANYLSITTTDRTGADHGYNRYDAVQNPDGDKRDTYRYYSYTSTFGGTSSSAPLVSGIMALGKEANPLMTIRMAKHSLSLPTVTDKVDADNTEWVLNNQSKGGDGVQRNFNPNYGFGLIQADKFVNKIAEVAYITKEQIMDINATKVNQAIPDNDPAGRSVTFTINPALPIESIEVGLQFSHKRRGDLRAYLISPDGTESCLFNDTSVTITEELHRDDAAVTDFDWTFLTNAFWGEKKNGTWTLKMVDVAAENTGTWLQYGLRFHLGKMEVQTNKTVDFGASNIEAESLTMTQYDNAAYKINNGYTFTVRDGLTLKKGALELNGTFDLQGAYDSVLDGKLTGTATGIFYKSGVGTLTINGDASGFSGTMDIGAGRVKVGTGGVLGGNVEIRSGGTLSGTGKVSTVFVNKGMVEPGNSIGTLTVTGNYTQNATGGLTIEVASTTSNDLLAVGGVAELDGLLKTVWQGSGVPKPNTSFASFLTAKKVIGKFSSFSTYINPTLKFIPQYTADEKDVYLVTERDYANSSLQSSLNPNQRAISNMLSPLVNRASGDLDSVLNKIDALSSNAQVAAAFDALSPIGGAAHTTMSSRAAVFQAVNAAGRLDDLRAGMQGFSFSGLEIIDADIYRLHDRRPVVLAANGDDLRGMLTAEADPNWGVFAKGSMILGDQKDTPDQKGYDFRNNGVTLGMDYRLAPRAVAGVLFGYNYAKSSINDAGSSVKMEGYAAGIYGSLYGDALYGDTQVSYGWNRYDNTRRIVFPGLDRTATSSPSGDQFSAYGGTGYDFKRGNWTLGPTLSLQYIRLSVGDYAETGADSLNLHVDHKTVESLLGSAGVRIAWRWEGDGIKLFPRLWAAWRHEFSATDHTTIASLAQTGSAFSVTAPGLENNYLSTGAGISLQWRELAMFFLNYDIQFGQHEFWAQGVNAGVRLAF